MDQIIIKNKKIIQFFQKYPMLDCEQIVISMVDIFNNILSQSEPDENKSLLFKEIQNINIVIQKMEENNKNIINSKILEMKKEYIQDLQNIIVNNK